MTIQKKLIEKLAIEPTNVDFSSSSVIEETGVYLLDPHSSVILIKDYIRPNDIKEILATAETLDFKQMQHKTGTREARSTFHIGPTYTYSDITHPENNVWPDPILKLKAKIEYDHLCPLNSVLVNKYEKHQYIPLHADNEEELKDNPTVFSISVGETRNMVVKKKYSDTDDVKEVSFQLQPGTLIIMAGDMNKNWLHSVPKQNSAKNIRYNLTFRYISSRAQNISLLHDSTQNTELKSLKNIQEQLNRLNVQINQNQQQLLQLSNPRNHTYSDAVKNQIVKQPTANEVALFKSEVIPERGAIVELINSQMSDDQKIELKDIHTVNDVRGKKGPLLVTFNNLSTKIKVLKLRNNNFLIQDSLSKKNLALRKLALELKNLKLIHKVWSFRGEIHYTLPDSQERHKADSEVLKRLKEDHMSTSRE